MVLSDLRLPVGDGFGVLQAAKDVDPELPVIVMTAFGGIQDAVAAMKAGAMDFLAKPVDPDHLLLLVERALAQRRLITEYTLLKEELAARRGAPDHHRRSGRDEAGLAGRAARRGHRHDGAARRRERHRQGAVRARGARAEPAREWAVRRDQLRRDSRQRCSKPSCSATSAARSPAPTQRKLGKFELANRGTLFLDEIGELPLALQGKILRALEERTFDRLGGTTSVKVDVRVVAATNRI